MGKQFQGKPMAGGGKYNMYNPTTLAHKTLPFKTHVLLINEDNGKSLCGVVRDRGPYIKGRSYDLSYAGAKQLGILQAGVGKHITEKIHGC
jgi:rare lipoprotein A